MYRVGYRIPKDLEQAAVWARMAADQGDAFGQSILGEMYANGEGVRPDLKQAISWIRKAAEQGARSAQYQLGVMYLQGRGIPQDYLQAYAWISVAVANGYNEYEAADGYKTDYAIRSRELAAARLTPRLLTEAQALSHRYFKDYPPKK